MLRRVEESRRGYLVDSSCRLPVWITGRTEWSEVKSVPEAKGVAGLISFW